MNFKRYVESSDTWVDSHYIHGTSTDTITLPTTIYGDGTNASLTIKGNTVQNGMPSPSNPVSVDGVGELETSGEHAGDYKIPISSANTTTPVYLGETQSTRWIKKLVLDGTEDWTFSSSDANRIVCQLNNLRCSTIVGMCTHIDWKSSYDSSEYNRIVAAAIDKGTIYISLVKDLAGSTIDTFTAYLAQQYSNGTPVTVYYIPTTPETIISNEPLYKIDNYSDSISASIPTTDGANTLDIPTTLQPSSVDVNYHGWHPMSDVHEYHVGTNLIDCAIENGGYDAATGKKISGDYYRTADYIAVEPNTDYIFGRGGVSLAVYVCLYTSDKTFIERLYPRSGEYFTTSESTYYITIYRSNTTTSEQWQLNKGQSILPYEAYYEPYWE